MSGFRKGVIAGLFCTLALAAGGGFRTFAQQTEAEGGKLRLGFYLGGTWTGSEIESEAGNTLFLEDPYREPVDFLRDPRNDTAALGAFNFGYGVRASLSGSYQFNDRWSIELSSGYQRSNAGNVEIQLEPLGIPPDQQFQFQFDVYQVPAGTIEQVPVDLTIAARFRPKASVRPFVGFGFGYMLVGFNPSGELDQLSMDLDASRGVDTVLEGPAFGRKFLNASGVQRSLSGATVDAPDAWTWHGTAGLEWAFRKDWSFVSELRYVGANSNFSINFDGRTSLGRGVPQGIQTLPTNRPPDSYPYGAVSINEGGLVDGGGLYVQEVDNTGQIVYVPCDPSTAGCQYYRIPDGQKDLGLYYVQGGEIRYSYFGMQFGIRYTF